MQSNFPETLPIKSRCTEPFRVRIGLPIVLIILGAAAYSNSFSGAFILDDEESILGNPYIVRLWPMSWLSAMPKSTVAGRPIASLSLAVNYAVSGYSVWSYHFFNLLVHILAGLTLFGIVRRTLLCERLRERFGKHSAVLAWAVAAIWLVHPIQTQSVTYIIQRTESLMGLFYLLTLYSAIRAMESGGGLLWPAVSVICCGLGMGTKEVMVTAPVMVLLYDRAFFAGSFAAAFRRRWGLYAGLAGTWLILAALLWSGPRQEQKSGFTVAAGLSYAANQGIVILRYLRLSVWPKGLCLDYSWPKQKDWGKLALPAAIVLGILAVTVWGLIRNKAWSYPVAWFFGVLSVTSSFVPVADLIFEHRMYLPLAGLAVLLVAGSYVLLERWSAKRAGIILAAVIVVLCLATYKRNSDYRSAESIWRTVLDVTPENPRAHNCLGSVLRAEGRFDEAINCFHQAIRLKPGYASAYNNLGIALQSVGNFDEAVACFQRSVQIDPDYADGYYNLGKMFQLRGKLDDAVRNYQQAIRLNPGFIKAYNNLGIVLAEQGKADEAVSIFHQVLRIDPDYAEAYLNLGGVFQLQGNIGEAESCYRRALQINPKFAPAAESLKVLSENKK